MDTNYREELLEGILKTIKDCIKMKKMQAKIAKANDDEEAIDHITEQVAHLFIVLTTIESALAEGEEDE